MKLSKKISSRTKTIKINWCTKDWVVTSQKYSSNLWGGGEIGMPEYQEVHQLRLCYGIGCLPLVDARRGLLVTLLCGGSL